jgi:hypothetical protein
MTARKAPAKPVADLTETRAARSRSRQSHPAGKQAPAAKKAAPAKAAKPAVEAEKRTYSATARCGKVNSRTSATVLTHALDVKISGKKQPHWSAGVIVGFYSSREAAEKVAAEINGGAVDGWSDAVVVAATPVSAAVSA